MMGGPLLRIMGLWGRQTGWLLAGLVVSLAALVAGVGLMAAAGFTIGAAIFTGALAVPAILRALGSARVVLRYAERLVTHGATFRALADMRVEARAPVPVLQRLDEGERLRLARRRHGFILQAEANRGAGQIAEHRGIGPEPRQHLQQDRSGFRVPMRLHQHRGMVVMRLRTVGLQPTKMAQNRLRLRQSG